MRTGSSSPLDDNEQRLTITQIINHPSYSAFSDNGDGTFTLKDTSEEMMAPHRVLLKNPKVLKLVITPKTNGDIIATHAIKFGKKQGPTPYEYNCGQF